MVSPVVGVLVGIEGTLVGELYPLRDGENTLGRDPDCSVRFPESDARISRRHARVVHSDGLFAIEPLNPDNPTRVSGQRIGEVAELPDRGDVSIGSSVFRLLAVGR